jgi:large subunit ribosomal protein L2
MVIPFGTLSSRSSGGRGFRGRIAVRHRGGGCRRRLRPPVFNLAPLRDAPGWLLGPSSPPGDSLVALATGWIARLPRPLGLLSGSPRGWSSRGSFGRLPGSGSPLGLFPPGSPLHLLEGRAGTLPLVRSPGAGARLLRHYRHPLSPRRGKSLVRLPSGQLRLFPSDRLAAFGTLAPPAPAVPLGRAGDRRRLGVRPSVRGVAMNPIDHPHGGGQGKTSGGRPSSSPWGVYTKGVRTRSPRSPTNRFFVSAP